jgi:signal transduction histidine kinase
MPENNQQHIPKQKPPVQVFGKIGRRLLGWFLLVALIPLLFMGYQGYYFARLAVQREVFLHMEAIAQSKQQAISQWFSERTRDMRVLAANPALIERSSQNPSAVTAKATNDAGQMLTAFQDQSQSYSMVCLYDLNEQSIFCSAGEGALHIGAKADSLVRKARESNGPVMGPIYLNSHIGPAMNLAQVVRDESGQVKNVIVATLALSHTLNPIILDTTGLGLSGQAYLIDRNKVMLTPSRFMNHPSPLTHTMDSEGIRTALKGGSGTGVYRGFEGQDVIGAWVSMPDQQWVLIAEMNASEAFAPLATLRKNALIVAILTMGAILIVVALISRSLSLPIRKLADASLAVSEGDLDRTVVVKLNDELGELAERFNRMVQSLKESQRQLVQSARLAAIGELVASVVHEVRNPLSAVKMNLRILETKCSTDPVIAEHFRLARGQTDRMESMLSELLDYSKPITLNLAPVAIADMISDAVRDFESEAKAHSIGISVRIAEGLTTVRADAPRLHQVLLNLLINARQATENGGKISITAEKYFEQNREMLRLSIRDTGQGIPEDNLQHIFEPFFTTRKQGTGLGLSNARKIVEAHGGALSVESKLLEGTTVHVTLPVV